jgi:hypothetical protein
LIFNGEEFEYTGFLNFEGIFIQVDKIHPIFHGEDVITGGSIYDLCKSYIDKKSVRDAFDEARGGEIGRFKMNQIDGTKWEGIFVPEDDGVIVKFYANELTGKTSKSSKIRYASGYSAAENELIEAAMEKYGFDLKRGHGAFQRMATLQLAREATKE